MWIKLWKKTKETLNLLIVSIVLTNMTTKVENTRDQNKTKIIQLAHELFGKYGIRSVTMDELAKALAISKKTLYQYFKNKEDLVTQIIHYFLADEMSRYQKIHAEAGNAIDEMLKMANYIISHLKMMNPTTMYDIQKYYPNVWQLLEKHRTEFVYSVVLDNLKKGMKEGIYRKNINAKIIAKLYVVSIQVFLDNQLFKENQLKPVDIYTEMFKYHIYGVSSEKGIQYLKNNIQKVKQNSYDNYSF